jgi:hypothetical protein
LAAACAVLAGEADCCPATRAAAQIFGLGFVPQRTERYDLVMRRQTMEHPPPQAGNAGRVRHHGDRRGAAGQLSRISHRTAFRCNFSYSGFHNTVNKCPGAR